MSLETLSRELNQTIADIQNEKVSVRSKALEKLEYIIDNRSEELVKLLLSHEHLETLPNWEKLYHTIRDAMEAQVLRLESSRSASTFASQQNKNREYVNALRKLIDLANRNKVVIPYKTILNSAFKCFEDRSARKHFDLCFFQIVKKHVLCSKGNLGDILPGEWTSLLSASFDLYRSDNIQKLNLFEFMTLVVQHGSVYSHLANELHQFVPKLINIIADDHKYKTQRELMKTIFEFTKHLAINQRISICLFTETVLDTVIKSYEFNMEPDAKLTLFKLLHTTLIVHYPQISDGNGSLAIDNKQTNDVLKNNYADDPSLWYKHLRSIFHIIEREIIQLNRQSVPFQSSPTICRIFVQLAARACAVIFWDENIWYEANEEQQQKRRRCSNKIQRFMDLIEGTTFCWRWMAILSQLLQDHPFLLAAEDFQPLLKLLVDFQPTIQYTIQIKIFINIVEVMLLRENDLKSHSVIQESFLIEHWNKILQLSFRNSTTNIATSQDNLSLLKILIDFKKIMSMDFLETLINAILSNSIKKSDASIDLMISVFRSVNIDLLKNVPAIRTGAINWLSPRESIIDLKKLLESDGKFDSHLAGELNALCVLSKAEKLDSHRTISCKQDNTDEFQTYIKELELNLQYQSIRTLIITESNGKNTNTNQTLGEKLPDTNSTQTVINESYLQELEKVLSLDDDFKITENCVDDFMIVANSLATYLHVLNYFLVYKSMDEEYFSKSFLKKRIAIKVEQLNMIAERFLGMKQESKDVFDILDKLLLILNEDLLPIIRNYVLSQPFNTMLIKWLAQQLSHRPRSSSQNIRLLENVNELAFRDKIQLKCFVLLAYFSTFKGDNGTAAFDAIADYEYNYECVEELFMVFEIVKIISNQDLVTERQAHWTLDSMKLVCKRLTKHQKFIKLVAQRIPKLTHIIRPFASTSVDLTIMITTFLKQSKKKAYGPALVIKIIEGVKYIAKEHCEELNDEESTIIYRFIANFLHFDSLPIQMATVEFLTYLFDKDWLNSYRLDNVVNVKQFQMELFDSLKVDELSLGDDVDTDTRNRNLAVKIQLFSSIIVKSYILRKQAWFSLMELCCLSGMAQDTVLSITKRICKELHGCDYAEIMKDVIPFLMQMWLIKNHHMQRFPWYLTSCQTQNEFFVDNAQMIADSVLKYRPSDFPDLKEMMPSQTAGELITIPIVISCLAYLVPLNICSRKLPETYKQVGSEMFKMLMQEIPQCVDYFKTHAMQILERLLFNTWDEKLFSEFFECDVDYFNEGHTINYEDFTKSLEYLQKKSGMENIIKDTCKSDPYLWITLLNSLKSNFQEAIFVEGKFACLFRICILIESISNVMTQKTAENSLQFNVNGFFVRDLVHFFCNTINENEYTLTLKLATCKYFSRFCKIILPKCALHFKPFLNNVVSVLIPLIKLSDNQKLIETSLGLLSFLIIEQQKALKEAIVLLDNFPNNVIFDELRDIHDTMKYNGRDFSLVEEIEYFLKVDKRKVEGLSSLKEHLSTKKNQLFDVYKSVHESRGFSEDCDESLIHRLIFVLLKTIQGSDLEKSAVAAQCLGELGSSNLGTIVLKSDAQHQIYSTFDSFEENVENLCLVALEKLNTLFLHMDARVLSAVSSACHYLLGTEVGNRLSAKFPLLGAFGTKANASGKLKSKLPLGKTKKSLELIPLFEPTVDESYSPWIKNVAMAFLNTFDDEHLQAVVRLQALFAEAILPLLVKTALSLNNPAYNKELTQAVEIFFENYSKYIDEHGSNEHGRPQPIYMNKAAIKSILQVVECIRMHNFNSQPKNRLPLPCIQIAKAANYCEAHFTAILYSELATIETDCSPSEKADLRSIMKEAHISIGEVDAVSAFLDPIRSRLQYHQLNQNWNQIYIHQDAISFNNSHSMAGYSNYLNRSGLYCLANAITKNQEDTVNYDCAWRLGDWNAIYRDEVSDSMLTQKTFNFDKYHYFALKSLRDKDKIGVKTFIQEARKGLIAQMKQTSFECTKNIYKNLAALQLLQQIEDFAEIQFLSDAAYSPEFILSKWKHHDSIPVSDFQYREPVLAQRIALLNSAGVRARRKIESFCQITDGVQEMLLSLAKDCRKEGFHNFAARYLASLHSINPSHEIKAHAYVEDAELNWSLGDKVLARNLVRTVSEEQFVSLSILTAKRLYGEYLAESCAEKTKDIIKNYFQSSLDLLSKLKENRHKLKNTAFEKSLKNIDEFEVRNKFKTYRSIAIYSDREYQQIATYKKSTIFEKKQSNIRRNEEQLQAMNSRTPLSKDEQNSKFILERSIKIDKDDIESTLKDYSEYLQLAMSNYLKAILYEPSEVSLNSSILFRIISLWLSNKSEDSVTSLLERKFSGIPTYKFIPIMPQITTHLSTADDAFSALVRHIVGKCTKDHPHHTLYQILSMSNAYADDDRPARESRDINVDRVRSAQNIMSEIRRNKNLAVIVQQMEDMCKALIKLANTPPPDDGQLPSSNSLLKLKNLNALQCPTVPLAISKNAQYSATVGIVKWSNKVSKVGGINIPKKLTCYCTDGQKYPQLLKGKDDLRQDAVMQQVFNILNDLLSHSKSTKKDRMHIRTYIVVPLSQRSGILEWCVNTIPLNEYLVGSKQKPGAHQRYRPNDLPPQQARVKLHAVPARTTPLKEVQKVFAKICETLKPVFHYFFYEKFQSPGVWFERRLAYAHSLATSSMIAYILGIGDRHVSNILIDESTAELVHIDFGIAFEQGKCLPTPETIPFRLTRDLVSALGSTGVEGVFRKSCEKTMEVLRQNKKTIVTILEVLLHDPLYSWTLTNRQISRRQNVEAVNLVEDEDLNAMAERALIRLEEKLDGKHVSRSDITTVEGHVEILINEAMNPDNLCKLFVGWQAYL